MSSPEWLDRNGVSWDSLRLRGPNDLLEGEAEYYIHVVREMWSAHLQPVLAIVTSEKVQHALEDIGIPTMVVYPSSSVTGVKESPQVVV